MWRRIWQQDFKELWRGGRLPVVALALVLLVTMALWAGSTWVAFQRRAIDHLVGMADEQHAAYVRDAAVYLERHDEIGSGAPQGPVSVYWKRAYAWLRPKPVAVLAVGQSDLHAYYAVFHGVDQLVLHYADEIQNPLHLLIGKLDMAFVAAYLLPLLVIALAYDIVSGERDAGRLTILRVQAGSVLHVVMGRAVMRLLLLLLLLIGSVVVGLIIVAPQALGSGETRQFLLIASAHVAWWFSLTLAMNSMRAPAWLCGLALIGSWTVLVFLLPTLLHVTIERWYPMPSRIAHVIAASAFRQQVDSHRAAYLSQLLREQPSLSAAGNPTRQAIGIPTWYPEFIAYQIALERANERDEARFSDVLDRRERTASRWRFLSPSLVALGGTQRIAGTSVPDQLEFAAAVARFRQQWLAYTRGFIFRNEYLAREDFDAMPRFRSPTAAERAAPWTTTLLDTGYLLALAVMLIAWTVWRLKAL